MEPEPPQPEPVPALCAWAQASAQERLPPARASEQVQGWEQVRALELALVKGSEWVQASARAWARGQARFPSR